MAVVLRNDVDAVVKRLVATSCALSEHTKR